MMSEPQIRTTSVKEQRAFLTHIIDAPTSTVIVTEDDGQLAEYGGEFRRITHSAYVVTSVLASHAGWRVGTRLFAELE